MWESHIDCRNCLGLMAVRIKLVTEDVTLAVQYHAVMKQFLKLLPRIKCPFKERLWVLAKGLYRILFFPPSITQKFDVSRILS